MVRTAGRLHWYAHPCGRSARRPRARNGSVTRLRPQASGVPLAAVGSPGRLQQRIAMADTDGSDCNLAGREQSEGVQMTTGPEGHVHQQLAYGLRQPPSASSEPEFVTAGI